MPLKPENLPATIAFFSSPAWADLREAVEEQRPGPPNIQADALHAASQFRRGEGFDLCMKALLREAGVVKPSAPSAANPQEAAMDELKREGIFVDTHTD